VSSVPLYMCPADRLHTYWNACVISTAIYVSCRSPSYIPAITLERKVALHTPVVCCTHDVLHLPGGAHLLPVRSAVVVLGTKPRQSLADIFVPCNVAYVPDTEPTVVGPPPSPGGGIERRVSTTSCVFSFTTYNHICVRSAWACYVCVLAGQRTAESPSPCGLGREAAGVGKRACVSLGPGGWCA
jgi:hypothetical protein